MTFSIVGYCKETGMNGVAITTSSICVGSRCPWVRAGVGAVTSQNVTDPSIGEDVLSALEAGLNAGDAITRVMENRPHAKYRQVAVVDNNGRTAHFTGSEILGVNKVSQGEYCIAAGNLLSVPDVTGAMVDDFQSTYNQHLAERLLSALEEGIKAGGEVGPTHSAALLVSHTCSWPLVDLRVDWSDCPVAQLRQCWQKYLPQMNDYLTRALDPQNAPTYGVPGDL
ncbi:MAG: fimbrial assembly protein FimA [Acidiferrobacteraceae bacterium]|nr:fimbrial assembly protein FimA [Acidiferrobacteraceae bacterium]